VAESARDVGLIRAKSRVSPLWATSWRRYFGASSLTGSKLAVPAAGFQWPIVHIVLGPNGNLNQRLPPVSDPPTKELAECRDSGQTPWASFGQSGAMTAKRSLISSSASPPSVPLTLASPGPLPPAPASGITSSLTSYAPRCRCPRLPENLVSQPPVQG
jgi:hypothetical protein